MNQEQIKVIAAHFVGMQTAVVHLSRIVALRTEIDMQDLAHSFDETASSLPADIDQRAVVQSVLKHIASGIRDASAGDVTNDLLTRLRS